MFTGWAWGILWGWCLLLSTYALFTYEERDESFAELFSSWSTMAAICAFTALVRYLRYKARKQEWDRAERLAEAQRMYPDERIIDVG